MPDRTLGPAGPNCIPIPNFTAIDHSANSATSLAVAWVAATVIGGSWPDYVGGAVTMSFSR